MQTRGPSHGTESQRCLPGAAGVAGDPAAASAGGLRDFAPQGNVRRERQKKEKGGEKRINGERKRGKGKREEDEEKRKAKRKSKKKEKKKKVKEKKERWGEEKQKKSGE